MKNIKNILLVVILGIILGLPMNNIDAEESRYSGMEVTIGGNTKYLWDIISLGDKGEDVKALQKFLGLEANGICGPETIERLKDFRRMILPDILAAIKKKKLTTNITPISPISPVEKKFIFKRFIEFGAKGEDVKIIQKFLGLKADGSYGSNTLARAKIWQRLNNIEPTGVFDLESLKNAGLNISALKKVFPIIKGGYGFIRDPNWNMSYYINSTGKATGFYGNASSFIDINNDGLLDFLVSAGSDQKFQDDGGSPYNDAQHTVFLNTGKGFVRDPNWNMPYYINNEGQASPVYLTHEYFSYFNNDRLIDYFDVGSATVFLNTSKGFVHDPNWGVPKEGNLSVALNAFSKLIDINRDGLSDSIVSTGDGKKFENDGGSPYNDAGNTVFLNTGKGFVRDPNWDMPYYKLRDDVESPPQDNFYPLYHTYGWACENSTFIDLNKDGLVDYISTCDSSFFGDDGGSPYNDAQNTVFLNTGKGFVRDPNWDMPHEDNSPIILSIFSRLVDINKDGLVDFVNARDGVFQNDGGSPYNDSKNTVFLNTGKGFVRDPNWDMPYGISKGLIWGCRLNNLVDVNSDGLPDFVPIGNNSQFIEDGGSSFNDVKNTVFLNTGKDFVRDPNWDMPYFINSDKDIYDFYEPESIFTDLNKDGLVDFLITSYSYDNDVEKNYGIFKNDGGSLYNDATKTVFINTYKK